MERMGTDVLKPLHDQLTPHPQTNCNLSHHFRIGERVSNIFIIHVALSVETGEAPGVDRLWALDIVCCQYTCVTIHVLVWLVCVTVVSTLEVR